MRRDVSFLVLYRFILTDGRDRTPMSSESEWPSAERKERFGRTVRRKEVRRFVRRWRQRKRIGETASEIASSVIAVMTLLSGRVSLTQRSRSGISRRNHRWRYNLELVISRVAINGVDTLASSRVIRLFISFSSKRSSSLIISAPSEHGVSSRQS